MKRLCLPALFALTLGGYVSPSQAQYVYPNYGGQPAYYPQQMPMQQMQGMPMQQMQMPMPGMPMQMGNIPASMQVPQMPMGPMGPMMPGSPVMPVGAMSQPVVVPVYIPVVQQQIPMFGPVETVPEGGPLASPTATVTPAVTATPATTVSQTKVNAQPVSQVDSRPWYQKAKTFLFGN